MQWRLIYEPDFAPPTTTAIRPDALPRSHLNPDNHRHHKIRQKPNREITAG